MLETFDPWAILKRDRTAVEVAYQYFRHGVPVSETPHVMLATPAYNPPCLEFLRARDGVVSDLAMNDVDVTVITSPGDSLVMRGRHTLMHEFLKSIATHLLFWDVDIEPLDPTVVRSMVNTGHPIVGGACPFRGGGGRVVCNLREEDKARKQVETDDTGCVDVAEVGTGFMLLERDAIVKLCMQNPHSLYWADLPTGFGEPMWALFDTQIHNERFLSEDYTFCKLAHAAGLPVKVYAPFEAQHWGRCGFRAQFMTAWGLKET